MTLTVTPGSASADAFADRATVSAFAVARGLTDWTGAPASQADDEAAIRRATAWLSTAFDWKGVKTNGRVQALAHPRVGMDDADGYPVASDTIAAEIIDACCIASAYERANPGGLSPAVTLTDRVKSETIGPISTTYADVGGAASSARPILTLVRDMVSGLTTAGASGIRLQRA